MLVPFGAFGEMNQCLIRSRFCFATTVQQHARFSKSKSLGADLLLKQSHLNLLSKRSAATSSPDGFYLKSLGIKDQLKPVRKLESFVKRSFFGELDKDYLDFPNLIASEREELLMTKQYDFVRMHFESICSHRESLAECGFFNVDSMTSFELMHLFESIGASLNYRPNLHANHLSTPPPSSFSSSTTLVPIGGKLLVTDSFMTTYQQEKSFVQSVLPLLVHNSLVVRAISGSSNAALKEKLTSGNSGGVLGRPNIAFAFCELNDKLAALAYPFWDSIASYNPEADTWTVNGSKSRIIKGDYDKFIICCKTLQPGSNGKSASDYGIASFVVDKAAVQVENDGTDNYGNEYLKISFRDLKLSREEHELFTSNEPNSTSATAALNIKAHGQLATSAIILGILKESVGNLVRAHQSDNELCNESLFRAQTFRLSQMLYSLESMLYLTASHFDSFCTDHIDLYLQAQVVKTLASEFAIETMNIFRFLLDPHQLTPVVSTQVVDVLNVLDAFLDSATSNRMLLATYGLRHIGAWKFDHIAKLRLITIYFDHFFKFATFPSFRKKVLHRSASSMDDLKSLNKRLRPALHEPANLLKAVLGQVMDVGDHILRNYGKDCLCNQIDMNRFASSVMSAFQMVSVISRANHTLQKDALNSQHELTLCRAICRAEEKKVVSNTQLIYGVVDTSEEKRSKAIHKRNMRFDGYFAKPTFDRII